MKWRVGSRGRPASSPARRLGYVAPLPHLELELALMGGQPGPEAQQAQFAAPRDSTRVATLRERAAIATSSYRVAFCLVSASPGPARLPSKARFSFIVGQLDGQEMILGNH